MRKMAVLALILVSAPAFASPAFAQQDAVPDQYGVDPPPAGEGETVVAEGVIEQQGITTYQYGTHVLLGDDGAVFYALQSETIPLDDYAGERVTVHGTRVPGYQGGAVEGGPDLLNVTSVDDNSGEQSPDDNDATGPNADTPVDELNGADQASAGVLPDTGGAAPTPWLLTAATLIFGAVLIRRVIR